MILYKNVDIKDLESILTEGILSLNVSENNNWDEGKRADNSCNVVYLFKPLTEENSFCNYGAALLEIDIPDDEIKENQLLENERYNGKYVEYIVDKVEVNCIKSIYIPKLFKNRIDLPIEIMLRITWCDIKANHYGDDGKENCPIEVLEQFAKTAKIMDASSFNFFRGTSENREIIDLYDIKYIFDEMINVDRSIL